LGKNLPAAFGHEPGGGRSFWPLVLLLTGGLQAGPLLQIFGEIKEAIRQLLSRYHGMVDLVDANDGRDGYQRVAKTV
jgi:hypothetical protein